MAIKQVFKIKDEILNDEYELSGQSGFLRDDANNIMLIDACQIGQVVLECCTERKDDTYIVSKKKISAMCNQISKDISNIILDNIYENAVDNAIDDEEIEVIK